MAFSSGELRVSVNAPWVESSGLLRILITRYPVGMMKQKIDAVRGPLGASDAILEGRFHI